MSKIGLNTLNSNPGRATSAPGFSGGNLSKAVSELKSYTEGTRKTKPSQKKAPLFLFHFFASSGVVNSHYQSADLLARGLVFFCVLPMLL